MKLKAYDIPFMILSIANVVLSYTLGISYLTYVLIGLLIILKVGKLINNENFLLYSLFVPNKYLQLLSVLLFLFFSNKLFIKKMNKDFIFILYIFFVATANCFFYRGFYINVIFQVGVYYCILRLLDDFDNHFLFETTLKVFDKMFFLQIITIIIEYLITHETKDALTGTLISAHYLGIFLIIYAFILWKIKLSIRKKITVYFRLIALVISIYLIDAKHIVLVFLLSMIFAKLFSVLKIRNKLTLLMFAITTVVALFLWSVDSGILKAIIGRYSFLSTYILNNDYNKKMQFYINTFKQLKGINGIFGYGVGLYGSQICITFAKGIIYSWNTSLGAYVHVIAPYSDAIRGIMTEWYTNTGIVISSMVLGYPLVSYIALVSELGIVGLYLFMQILDKKYRYCNGTFIIMFLLLIHFDTYFEIPCVFVLILIAESISNKKKLFPIGGNLKSVKKPS